MSVEERHLLNKIRFFEDMLLRSQSGEKLIRFLMGTLIRRKIWHRS